MLVMKGRHRLVSVALFLTLSSVSAVKKLNSIKDLKEIDFGQSVPTHSLVLLHWFANTIIIDHYNRIQLTFDPSNGDYGTHHYGNYDRLLGLPPRGHRYYTVGNLHQEMLVELPDHVVNPPTWLNGENRDRIIIRVCGERIDQVYITQHYDNSDYQGTTYDPYHTYQITTNLLRQIQVFPLNGDYQTLVDLRNRYRPNVDVSTVRNSWGYLACLGLFLCIVMNQTVYYQDQSSRLGTRQRHELNQNRGSVSNSKNRDDNLCLCVAVVCIIVLLCLCAAYLNKV